ncbi:hypothetical protein MPSYJ_21060 [Mycolicibacterium psychrotolerans]|uniref:Uncharacterized protein n=1 Tax=Mycolicibacterium psychrotolerans TaxID=216929 RepID=A0A7I7M8Z1_9MYCO|nr:hypothetical protein MPSYJ_21060 [Mycolicibacterium psychrotolerans]
MPDWRYEAVGGAVFLILMVMAGGGAIANANAGADTSDVTGPSTRHSYSIADRSDSTSPQEAQRSSLTSQTETTVGEADDADGSDKRPPTDESALTPADPPSSESPNSSSATTDTPVIEDQDNPITDSNPPAQDNGPAAEVDPPPDPSITTPDTLPVPVEDNPTTDANPPARDNGSATDPNSSTPEAVSPSESIASETVIATAEMTDDSAAGTTTPADSTITVSLPTPADDLASAASVFSAVKSVAATLVQPALPAFESSTVAPVPVTEVPVTVPLVSATTAFAPVGTLQWFVLLTWFQLQWLMQWQQQLNGWDATPGLRRLDARDTQLMSALLQHSLTPAYLATQFPWLRTTLGAPAAMPRIDLPIDHAFLQQISMTLAAEAASLPAIAEAVTNHVRSHLGFPLDSPCVSTFIRSVSVWALFTAAALGLFGMISLTGLGVTVGFRQAKAGYALQACGLARFTGPGPLGVVREAGFVDIRSRRSSAGPPRLRVVGTDMRDSA